MIEPLLARYAYVLVFLLVAIGLYGLLDRNLIKKLIGLHVFQTAIFLFFIVVAYRTGGNPPLVEEGAPFVNPLPHVVILTAIVVGVSLAALSLGLVVLLYASYGTIREDEIRALIDEEAADHGTAPGGPPPGDAAGGSTRDGGTNDRSPEEGAS